MDELYTYEYVYLQKLRLAFVKKAKRRIKG